MSNNVHGLTVKDDSGKTKAHPLYWVWHEKRKNYTMCAAWEDDVLEFHDCKKIMIKLDDQSVFDI